MFSNLGKCFQEGCLDGGGAVQGDWAERRRWEELLSAALDLTKRARLPSIYQFSFKFSESPAPEGDVVPLVCRAGVGVGTFTNPRLDRGLPVWQGGDSDPLGKYLSFDF